MFHPYTGQKEMQIVVTLSLPAFLQKVKVAWKCCVSGNEIQLFLIRCDEKSRPEVLRRELAQAERGKLSKSVKRSGRCRHRDTGVTL